MKITRKMLREAGACWSDEQIAERVPEGGVTLEEVLGAEDVDAGDRVWAALEVPGVLSDRELRLFACGCAERALSRVKEPDPRSVEAVRVSRRYADGLATEEELVAAREAAWAARAAAWAAAVREEAREAAWAAALEARDERLAQLADLKRLVGERG
jgi:hypothetical protein